MAIDSTAIGNTNTDVYTSSGSNAVTCIWICNTAVFNPATPSSGLTYLDLHLVKNGAGVINDNLVVNQLPIPAGESVTFDTERLILDNGDKIVASSALPANLVVTVSTIPV